MRTTIVRRWGVSAALVVVAVSACGTDSGSTSPLAYCTAPRSIALEITVIDAATGAGLAEGSTGSFQSATGSDSLWHVTGSTTILAGGEHLGVYSATVTHVGYATWSAQGVQVTQQGVCGNVLPVQLTAPLTRSS
ncbi:MAG: hypothetical protein U0132_13405 [Gemmatimonadaceae bacterium]